LIITLHRELWEGLFKIFILLVIGYFGTPDLINLIYFNTSHNNIPSIVSKITINTPRKKWIRGIHTSNKGPFIWAYDITKLSDNQNCLVKDAPFKTKTECANVLKTTRNSVTLYLDSNKIFNNKWIFSSIELSKEQLSKFLIPSTVWEVITGELLGDGYLSYDPINKPQINGRLEFTFSAKILHYVNYLKFNVLAPICTPSNPTPWSSPTLLSSPTPLSNPKMESKEPTQYWFSTKRLPAITNLYQLWYKQIDGKFIKVLPFNIEELLTPIALAHWIMGDGYFTNGTLKLCTDNFTKDEVLRLIKVLHIKYDIKATINQRTNPGGAIKWRIRISKLSMDKLILLVRPYIISEMLYKLGLK
jgi:hypothetical protein